MIGAAANRGKDPSRESEAMRQDPVGWLYDLQHLGVKLGLDNIRALLDVLEHPESAYPCLHVAGTNGKGSVAAMLSAMLRESGRRPGLFTSPHLVRPNERIRIDEADIATPDLHRLLEAMRQRIETGLAAGRLEVHPSFFETITATALTAFREREVGAAVLEVGLGGRLDATNAVESRVAVIVTLGLDHTKTLGPTLAQIAGEKAGIVKPGRPLVTGVEQPEGLAVLRRVCRDAGSPLLHVREHASVRTAGDGSFEIRTADARYRDLRLSLAGVHQFDNAAVAVVALETFLDSLGERLDPDAVRRGLAAVRWAGRLQWIPGSPPLLLDGAHNAEGAATLARFLEGWTPPRGSDGAQRARPVGLFGAMRGKDLDGILSPLSAFTDTVVVTQPGVERAAEADELLAAAERRFARAELVRDPAGAFERARTLAGNERYVLVAGSLYLVGQVLGLLERAPVPGPVSM